MRLILIEDLRMYVMTNKYKYPGDEKIIFTTNTTIRYKLLFSN